MSRPRYWPDGALDLSPPPQLSAEELRAEVRRLAEELALDCSPELLRRRVREAALPVADPELAEVVALAGRPLDEEADDEEGLDPETWARIDRGLREQVEFDLKMLAADALPSPPSGGRRPLPLVEWVVPPAHSPRQARRCGRRLRIDLVRRG